MYICTALKYPVRNPHIIRKIELAAHQCLGGDASMELIMKTQDDPTPWPIPVDKTPNLAPDEIGADMPGRAYFSALGVVRRKPGKRATAQCLSNADVREKLALMHLYPCPNPALTSWH